MSQGGLLHNFVLHANRVHFWTMRLLSQLPCPGHRCIDYYNALYMGLLLKDNQQCQLVQNGVAWAILLVPKRTYVTPLLHELLWLPVYFQLQYKVLVLTPTWHRSDYLRDFPFPITSTRPIWKERNVVGPIWWDLKGEPFLLKPSGQHASGDDASPNPHSLSESP